jgi:hypothetical protein
MWVPRALSLALQGFGVSCGLDSPPLRQIHEKGRPLGGLFHDRDRAFSDRCEMTGAQLRGDENPRRGFDGFARSESGQTNVWPWSAQARKGWVHGCTQQSQ